MAASIIGSILGLGGGALGQILGGGRGEIETRPAYAPPKGAEKALTGALQDLFGVGAGVTGAGVGQLAMIVPELWRELGYEATVVDRSEELAAAQQEVNDLQAQIAELDEKRSRIRGRPRTEKRKQRLQNLRKKIQRLEKNLAGAESTLTDLRAQPIQITGLRRLAPEELPATSYRSPANLAGQAVDLTLEQAIEALRGQVETDPTLLREFDEAEGQLHEKLRRQLGPGYETSTAGIQALADFDKRKAEAIASFTRDLATTRLEQGLVGETTLSDLIGAQLAHGTYLPTTTQEAGLRLGQAAAPGLSLAEILQRGRALSHPVSYAPTFTDVLRAAGMGGAVGEQLGAGLEGIRDWYENRQILRAREAPNAPLGTYMT